MSGGPGPEDRYSAASGNPKNDNNNGGYNSGMIVFSYIIGGIVVWSLIGWVLDILLRTHWIVLAGAFTGLAGGFYLSFARRFGPTRSKKADGNAKRSRRQRD
jgi:ATP synthase protein I